MLDFEAVIQEARREREMSGDGVDALMLMRALQELKTNCNDKGEIETKTRKETSMTQTTVREGRKRDEEERKKRRERAEEVEAFLRERVRRAEQEDAEAEAGAAGGGDEKRRGGAAASEVGEKSRASMHRILFLD